MPCPAFGVDTLSEMTSTEVEVQVKDRGWRELGSSHSPAACYLYDFEEFVPLFPHL